MSREGHDRRPNASILASAIQATFGPRVHWSIETETETEWACSARSSASTRPAKEWIPWARLIRSPGALISGCVA